MKAHIVDSATYLIKKFKDDDKELLELKLEKMSLVLLYLKFSVEYDSKKT